MQIEYLVRNGMTPCIEFAPESQAVVSSESCARMGNVATCYYDNRYWTMWKLPMFGCTDAGQVRSKKEISTICGRRIEYDYLHMMAGEGHVSL